MSRRKTEKDLSKMGRLLAKTNITVLVAILYYRPADCYHLGGAWEKVYIQDTTTHQSIITSKT